MQCLVGENLVRGTFCFVCFTVVLNNNIRVRFTSLSNGGLVIFFVLCDCFIVLSIIGLVEFGFFRRLCSTSIYVSSSIVFILGKVFSCIVAC